MSATTVYPQDCAKCGRKWGDHLHGSKLASTPSACPFVAESGELQQPVNVTAPEKLAIELSEEPPLGGRFPGPVSIRKIKTRRR